MLAYLLLGEGLHDFDLVGAAFVVAGIATVVKPTQPRVAYKSCA